MSRRTSRKLSVESLETRHLLAGLLSADMPPIRTAAEGEAFIRGSIAGHVYGDLNNNGVEDSGEPKLAGQHIFHDLNKNGTFEENEPLVITTRDGDFRFDELAIDVHFIGIDKNSVDSVSLPTRPHLGPSVNLVTGSGTSDVAIADFNGDGNPDIVTTNFGDNSLYIGLQTQSAKFTNMFLTRFPDQQLGIKPSGLTVRDFDGDLKPDIAVAASGEIDLLLTREAGAVGGAATSWCS